MSIWPILVYLAVGYSVMFGVYALALGLHEHFEVRRRIRERLGTP